MTTTPKQILVVEDERIVQMHLAQIVESSGHALLGAVGRSEAAIELARATRPDLVLMDIRLAQGDDGIECAKILKQDFGASILFITAHSSMETLARALPVAASGYLVKPFRVAEVAASIASALTDRERQRKASNRERALSSAVDSLGEAIFVLDSTGSIGFANPLAKQISGWSESQPSAGSFLECIASADHERLTQAIDRSSASPGTMKLEGLAFKHTPSHAFTARLESISESDEDCLLISLRPQSGDLKPSSVERRDSGDRLLVYSHDTFGLGHIRRCMNLIRAMSERIEGLCTLLVTGSPMAHKFELPPRTDYLKLPAVRKIAPDAYESRSLAMSEEGILTLRRNLLLRTVSDYSPTLLLVDHSPTGMNGELQPALDHLRRTGDCERILGLRDIIDSPARIAKVWEDSDMFNTLRNNYDHIVVYGSEKIYGTTGEYGFPEDLKQRTRYVNYVGQTVSEDSPTHSTEIEKGLVVVTIGGGDGGVDTVVQPFLEMMRSRASELGIHAEVLLGPFASRAQRAAMQELADPDSVVLHDFISDPTPLFARAELVISTAGYNISSELLAHAHRALLIPRVVHREEQLIRAKRLAELKLVSFLHPREATPDAIAKKIRGALAQGAPALDASRARQGVPLDGAQRMAEFVNSLVAARSRN